MSLKVLVMLSYMLTPPVLSMLGMKTMDEVADEYKVFELVL